MVWADGLSGMCVTQCVGDVGRAVAGFYCLVRWLLVLLPWMDIRYEPVQVPLDKVGGL